MDRTVDNEGLSRGRGPDRRGPTNNEIMNSSKSPENRDLAPASIPDEKGASSDKNNHRFRKKQSNFPDKTINPATGLNSA
jgi:hypothetical protein